jgi:hypothetical protein
VDFAPGGDHYSLCPPGGGSLFSPEPAAERGVWHAGLNSPTTTHAGDVVGDAWVFTASDAWVFTASDAWVAQRACGFLTVGGGLSRGGRWLHTTMAARCGASMRHVARLFSASSRGGEYVLKLCTLLIDLCCVSSHPLPPSDHVRVPCAWIRARAHDPCLREAGVEDVARSLVPPRQRRKGGGQREGCPES